MTSNACSCVGSLVVSELETTVRRLVALEASVTVVEHVTLEAMEETVVSVEVRKQYFSTSMWNFRVFATFVLSGTKTT